MRLCKHHWDKLKAACTARGMDHLIHRTGEEALECVSREVEGTSDPKTDFDPLLKANFMVWGRALHFGGLYLMGEGPEGQQYCPTCEAIKHMGDTYPGSPASERYPSMEDHWTDGVMDAVLEEARELGLMPRVS